MSKSKKELKEEMELQAPVKVYVFSKLRHNTITTLKALGNIKPTLVLEKGEVSMYKERHKNIDVLVLPENERGINYAKNYVLSKAKGWVWFLDDDIDGFFLFKDGKRTRISSDGLYGFEVVCSTTENVIMGGLSELSTKLPKKRNTFNTLCDKVVLLNADYMRAIGAKYDENLRSHGAEDFTLQCLSKAGRVMRSNTFTYHTKKIKEGGMQTALNENQEINSRIYLKQKWGSMFVEIVENNNHRLKINWRHFKNN